MFMPLGIYVNINHFSSKKDEEKNRRKKEQNAEKAKWLNEERERIKKAQEMKEAFAKQQREGTFRPSPRPPADWKGKTSEWYSQFRSNQQQKTNAQQPRAPQPPPVFHKFQDMDLPYGNNLNPSQKEVWLQCVDKVDV